jgi:hypothetical protein
LANPVTDDRLADYLRWWLAVEAPKGKPGRRPLARSTLAHYRVVIEHHLIPELGHRKVGQLTVRELDAFASRKLAAGYAPATVNPMRETLRSALSTAVRQDRLTRNVALRWPGHRRFSTQDRNLDPEQESLTRDDLPQRRVGHPVRRCPARGDERRDDPRPPPLHRRRLRGLTSR